MQPQTMTPFKIDFLPARIRPFNYERLVPTKKLTDKKILKYALLGKYGPDLQKKLSQQQEHQKRLVRLKKEDKKKLENLLKELGY